MNKVFRLAFYVVLVGVLIMAVGGIWRFVASVNYVNHEGGALSNDREALQVMVAEHNHMVLAGGVFDLGLILIALAIGVIAYGMSEPKKESPELKKDASEMVQELSEMVQESPQN